MKEITQVIDTYGRDIIPGCTVAYNYSGMVRKGVVQNMYISSSRISVGKIRFRVLLMDEDGRLATKPSVVNNYKNLIRID